MEISEGFRMNLVFISNYFSHHQQPLADALSQKTDGMGSGKTTLSL